MPPCAALVSFLFRKNDDEEKLLAQYHAEGTLPNNSGECTADHIALKDRMSDRSV